MESSGMHLCRYLLLATLALAAGGCASPDRLPSRVPVGSRHYQWAPEVPKREKILLVFLPGRGTTGQDFVRQDFLSACDPVSGDASRSGLSSRGGWRPPGAIGDDYRGSGLAAEDRRLRRTREPMAPGGRHPPRKEITDAVTVDLTYPYYEQRIATRRLHDDVVAPARAAGYRRIWLVGVSMGGLGAIFYDHDYPGEISGIVAIAPFLGEKNVVAEIQTAGGLDRWQPRQPLAKDDFQRQLWFAIRAAHYDQPGHLPLVLGYGAGDRFSYGHRLLASTLPADHVFKTFGFHDWGTWHHLWQAILASPVSPLGDPAAER